MLSQNVRRLLLTLTLLLGVLALDHYAARSSATDAPAPTETHRASSEQDATPPEQVTTVEKTSAAAATQQSEPAPANMQQLLPSLTERVTDWRKFQPKKLTIAPYPDTPIEFEQTSVREENGRIVWVGRNALTGAFLTTVATENDWHAVLMIPGANSIEAHISGANVRVVEAAKAWNCATGVPGGEGAALVAPTGTVESPEGMVGSGAALVVDVLFFYDAGTLAAENGSASAIESTLAARIASSNLALENSGISNFRWRYLGAYQVPTYTATSNLVDDLNKISYTSNSVGQFVDQKADLHGADQVVLYVSGSRNYAGYAWLPTGTAFIPAAAIVWNDAYDFSVLAHELGHNFGCYHDRQTEHAADNDGKYHYGHRFSYNGKSDVGTIMSYAGVRLPYFSNPNITYQEDNAAPVAVGAAIGTPKAAYAAKILIDRAAAISDWRAAVGAPVIISHPQSTTLTAGDNLSLSVTASGSGLSYQWKKNSSDISGATSATYSKSSVTSSDAGSYTVVVTNSSGSATSNAAAVTVNSATPPAVSAPVITSHPQSVTLISGDSFSVSVTASGSGLSYQWRRNGTAISGATSSTYHKVNASTSDSGTYTVVVSNSGGSATSNGATVTVNIPAPVITSHPQSATLTVGGTLSLSVGVSGSNLSYQWRKNGTNISGATSATYSKTNVAAGDAASYTVRVSNSTGWATSNAAVIAVNPAKPTITSQPQSVTVNVGGNLSLTVTASGTGLSYQWYKDEEPVSGATSATYSKSNVGFADEGDYTVVVSNAGGSVTSVVVTVTVDIIVSPPSDPEPTEPTPPDTTPSDPETPPEESPSEETPETPTPSPSEVPDSSNDESSSAAASSGGGGGGGGGAVGGWAMSALALAAAARMRQQLRRRTR